MPFYPDELLQAMRQQADPVADDTVAALLQAGQRDDLHHWWHAAPRNTDPLPPNLPNTLVQYLAATAQLPLWADQRRIRRGHRFFAAHARSILSVLGCLSLPYCYAAADGAQVLWLSQRIRQDTRRRLAETGQFLLDVMAPDAFAPTGRGIRSIQQVRLIHAVARYYSGRSPQWQAAWGVPVNQEDMAGTNLAFSYIVLTGLRKLGVQWDKTEAGDYLYTWNVIGAMLGLDERLLPADLQQAYWLDRRIAARHFRRSEAGVGLTAALLQSLYEINDSDTSRLFVNAYVRHLLGTEVADLLDVPAAPGGAALVPAFRTVNLLGNLFASSDPARVSAELQREISQQAETTFRLPGPFG
ncbi:MAG: DUF2236 domain-containing protein [Cytophagales bacterium]|nr:DUF2236 domain-containing protein [Cytophagales bacterium]